MACCMKGSTTSVPGSCCASPGACAGSTYCWRSTSLPGDRGSSGSPSSPNSSSRMQLPESAGWAGGRLGDEGSPAGGLRSAWPVPGACPACDAETAIAEGYAALLFTSSRDDIRHALSCEDRGLCVPHLVVAFRTATDPRDASLLVDRWARPAQCFCRLLAEVIRKQSYQYRHDPPGEEADAWRLAPEWLSVPLDLGPGHEQSNNQEA